MSQRLIPPYLSGASRPLRAGAAVTGLVAAVLVPAAATARAHSAVAGTTTCAGSQTVAYSPGLTLRKREAVLHGTSTLSRCASSADPTITGGRSTFKATGRLSCTSGDYSGTRKVTWNNGRTSTMSFRSVVSVSAGESVVAIRGEVTDGEFSGQKWSAAFTMFTARPAACATPEGLPTAYGRLLLTVGSLVPGRSAPDLSRPSRH
ncbi:hypothetical protein GCM10027176_84260 [Actinoallomurus bryophytorum]|uniref:Uncharacterized protein n=1 Tax=Actinoallomurus bryophytorum TaxID=1490222 RepID=A0A543CTS7_9ACTN|nr:hypothetical protein [Actinoallomurus bryophytorum]TQM00318.1 hypothetical protein FB559_6029 [Actinoallomurus bryophytorum]